MSEIQAVVTFIHDGVYGIHTGAGRSNQRFLQTVISNKSTSDLTVSPIYTAVENPNYMPDWYQQNLMLFEKANARLRPIMNGADGLELYGYPANWREASTNASEVVAEIKIAGGEVLVCSFDTPFIFLTKQLAHLENVRHLHIPRSTGLLHDPADTQRIDFEREAYGVSNFTNNTLVGATSRFMAQHLVKDYGVNEERIVPIYNGILLAEKEKISEEQLIKTLNEVGIGENEPFILAYGRAHAYKGFHVLLDALHKLGGKAPRCVIVAAAAHANDSYIARLKYMVESLKLNVYLHDKFSIQLPEILQQAPNLKAVVVPSLQEPFGLIPIENFANPYSCAPLIVSNTGGLTEQVIDGETGFLFEAGDSDALAEVLFRSLYIVESDLERIKANAYRHVRQNYDYNKNIIAALDIMGFTK